MKQYVCDHCDGTGRQTLYPANFCGSCEGHGHVSVNDEDAQGLTPYQHPELPEPPEIPVTDHHSRCC